MNVAAWQLLNDCLSRHAPAMLLYVVHSHGSSPGRQGFCLTVAADGTMRGSIGGGIMEHKLVHLALERLAQPTPPTPTLHRQLHDKAAPRDQSGMICSGEQTVLLYPAQTTDALAVRRLLECLQRQHTGRLRLSAAGIGFEEDGTGSREFEGYTFGSEEADGADDGRVQRAPTFYEERVGMKPLLSIIGGGHCALALSRLACMLDFRVHLYENRPQLNMFLENDYAHQKTTVADYAELAALLPDGPAHYVVIMTFGYRTDAVAGRALLPKSLAFLGMLGSQNKIDQLLADYRAAGIPAEQLARLHAPVGLPIHSQTPEEIAVSIAAQLIGVKNASPPGPLSQKEGEPGAGRTT